MGVAIRSPENQLLKHRYEPDDSQHELQDSVKRQIDDEPERALDPRCRRSDNGNEIDDQISNERDAEQGDGKGAEMPPQPGEIDRERKRQEKLKDQHIQRGQDI